MLRGMVIVALLVPAVALARQDPEKAGCGEQSGGPFPGAYTDSGNLVVGPLAIIGGGRKTSAATVEEFGGNKFPLLVRAGREVEVRVTGRGSLNHGGGRAKRKTFDACGPENARSKADGEPVTFWSGFVLLSKPACVRLKIWVDDEVQAHRARIHMGRSCTATS